MSEEFRAAGISLTSVGSIIVLLSLLFITKPTMMNRLVDRIPTILGDKISLNGNYLLLVGVILIIWGCLIPEMDDEEPTSKVELMEFPPVIKYIPFIIMWVCVIIAAFTDKISFFNEGQNPSQNFFMYAGIVLALGLYGLGIYLSTTLVYVVITTVFVVVSLEHNDMLMILGMLGLLNIPLLR